MTSSKEQTKLTKQRQAIQVQVSNELKRTDGAIADGSVTATALRTSIARLTDYRVNFKEKSELILDLVLDGDDEAEADKEIEIAANFDDEVIGHIVRFQAELEDMQRSVRSNHR